MSVECSVNNSTGSTKDRELLRISATDCQLDQFFRKLTSAREGALLLDYDGTLAPFRRYRYCAVPYPNVPELLHAIMWKSTTHLVLVSGRPAMELRRLVPLFPAPEIWGSNGLERLKPDGTYDLAEISLEATEALSAIDHSLEAAGLRAVMEFKPGATAVHWRGLSRWLVEDIRERILRVWVALSSQNLLALSEFDGGMEFRLRLRNKGDAVRQVLHELCPDAPVAYLGDDWTDEDAFRALGDRGLSVLVRTEFRATAADAWVRPPEGVVHFLAEWLLACGGKAQ